MTIRRGSHAFRRQFDVAGVIRLGGEQSLGEWNKELSFFRLTSADPTVPAAEKLAGFYGSEPTELHVMFPSDDPDEVFDDAYELWRGSKKKDVKGVLLCRGDGISCQRIIDEDDPWEREELDCPTPEHCAFAHEHTPEKLLKDGGSACGAVGRLRVICYRVSVLEIYEIRTGSINAFQGLRNKLLDIKEHPLFAGRLKGIPLTLRRVPKKNRFGKVNYPVRIEVPSWDDWQQEAGFIQAVQRKILGTVSVAESLPEPTHRPALPPAPESMPEDKVARSAQKPVGEDTKPRSRELSERLADDGPPDDPMPEDAGRLLSPEERTPQTEGAAVAERARKAREEATDGNKGTKKRSLF